jgi:molybdenum cofactor cytidylyltransferase
MPHSNPSRITAILLAAGRSTRMGQPKQLLPLGQTTLLQQTLSNLQQTTADEILLVLGAAAETIQSQLPATLRANLRILRNPVYEQGMATSIQAGIAAVNPDHHAALIALADQPFIRPETYDRLMNEYRRTQAKILLPTYRGQRGNPLLLDRMLFSEANSLQGDTGFRAILSHHLEDILKLEVEDSAILQDIDTPADYDRLRQTRAP